MLNRVKLNEAQLKKIVSESVKRVLKENGYDVNSDEWKNNYDKMRDDSDLDWLRWEKEDRKQTEKEISDYENLPDKARHPYGSDIPDFSDRRNNKKITDKLAAKKPNSVFMKQQDKELGGRKYAGMDSGSQGFKDYLKDKGIDLNTQRLSKEEIDKYWEKYKKYCRWLSTQSYFDDYD